MLIAILVHSWSEAEFVEEFWWIQFFQNLWDLHIYNDTTKNNKKIIMIKKNQKNLLSL